MTPHIKHLIIAALIAMAVLAITWKLVASQDQRAHDANVLAQHQLELDAKAQKAAESQAQNDRLAYDALKAQMASQNAQLLGQIASLAASLKAQQDRDRVLPPSELADRQVALIGGVPGDVKPVPDGLLMTLPAARQTVVMLEEVPADRQTIKNDEQIIVNNNKSLTSLETRADSAEKALAACKQTQQSADVACKAQVAEGKAKNKKRNIVLAILGFVSGLCVRGAI